MAMFKGLNGKRFLIGSFPKVRPPDTIYRVSNIADSIEHVGFTTIRRIVHLFELQVGTRHVKTLSSLCQSLSLSFPLYSTYVFSLAGNKDPFLGQSHRIQTIPCRPVLNTDIIIAATVTVILSCCGMLAVIIDALLVEKIGRRRMTLIGFTGACSGILLMAIVGCFDYENAQLGAVLVSLDVGHDGRLR